MMKFQRILTGTALLLAFGAFAGDLQTALTDALVHVRSSEADLKQFASPPCLTMGRNEEEALQVLVRGDAGTHVQVAGISWQQEAPFTCRIHRIVDKYLESTKNFQHPAGLYPDALSSSDEAMLQQDETCRFFVVLKTPANAAPGTYQGRVRLKTPSGEKELPFSVRVFNYALPDRLPYRADVGLWQQFLYPAYGIGSDDEFQEFLRKQWPFLQRYHVSPRQPLNLNWPEERQQEFVRDFDAAHFNWMSLPGWQKKDPAFFEKLEKAVASSEFLQEYALLYYTDEPWTKEARLADAEGLRMVKEKAPHVKTMVTFYADEEFIGLVDVWSPPTTELTDARMKLIRQEQEKGRGFFTYDNAVLFTADTEPAVMRAYFYRNFSIGSTGTILWCGTYWIKDPVPLSEKDLTTEDLKPYSTDGCLMYPGENGFIPTLRLENLRDSLEDAALLMQTKEAAEKAGKSEEFRKIFGAAAKLFPKKLVKSNFKNDPAVLRTVRAKLGELLEQCEQ